MLPAHSSHPSFILQLNTGAQVSKIIFAADSIPTLNNIKNFLQLIDNENNGKANLFLDTVLKQGRVMEWELNYRINGEVLIMSTSAFLNEDSIFLLASGHIFNAQQMYDELILINSEQLNSIRMLRKQLFQLVKENEKERSDYLEQIQELKKELETLRKTKPESVGNIKM